MFLLPSPLACVSVLHAHVAAAADACIYIDPERPIWLFSQTSRMNLVFEHTSRMHTRLPSQRVIRWSSQFISDMAVLVLLPEISLCLQVVSGTMHLQLDKSGQILGTAADMLGGMHIKGAVQKFRHGLWGTQTSPAKTTTPDLHRQSQTLAKDVSRTKPWQLARKSAPQLSIKQASGSAAALDECRTSLARVRCSVECSSVCSMWLHGTSFRSDGMKCLPSALLPRSDSMKCLQTSDGELFCNSGDTNCPHSSFFSWPREHSPQCPKCVHFCTAMSADGHALVFSTSSVIWYRKVPSNVPAPAALSGPMSCWPMAPPWSSHMVTTVVLLACAAVSGLTCCAFVSVQMHCPSTTRSIWSTVATSRLLAWRECGGGRRRENQARSQLASGQCTQRRSKNLRASAGLLTKLRLARMDSSLAGTCTSCNPG